MRFVMVDRIESPVTAEGIRGRKLAASSEDVFEHHFPERAIVPGNLILEACTQLAAWHVAACSDFANWLVLASVTRARWMSFAQPGDVLDLQLEAGASEGASRAYTATVLVEGQRRAAIEFVGQVVALDALMDPAAARERFTQLGGTLPCSASDVPSKPDAVS